MRGTLPCDRSLLWEKSYFCQLYLVNFRPTMGEKDICRHFLVCKQKSIQTDGSKCGHFYDKFRVIRVLPQSLDHMLSCQPLHTLLSFHSHAGLTHAIALRMQFRVINNGNRTQRSPIQSVTILVIRKIGRLRSGSLICQSQVLLPTELCNHNNYIFPQR